MCRQVGIEVAPSDIFKAKTDRGSNMIKGYDRLSHDPCANHLFETDVKVWLGGEGSVRSGIQGVGLASCRAP